MTRLKLNEWKKSKIIFSYIAITFLLPFVVLCGLRFVSSAAVNIDGSLYVNRLPLMYGGEVGNNQGKPSDLDLSDLHVRVLNFLINDGYYSPSVKAITYQGQDENGNIFITAYSNYANFTMSGLPDEDLNGFVYGTSFTWGASNGVYNLQYNLNSGVVSLHSHSISPFILGDYLQYMPSTGNTSGHFSFYYLIRNQFLIGYPLYLVDDYYYNDVLVFQGYDPILVPDDGNDYFTGKITGGATSTIIGGGGTGEGSTSPGSSTEYDLDIELDLSPIQDSINDLSSKIDELKEQLRQSQGTINSNIGSIISQLQGLVSSIASGNATGQSILAELQSIYAKLVDTSDNGKSWLQKIYELLSLYLQPPSQEEVDSAFQNSFLYSMVSNLGAMVNSVRGMFQASPKSVSDMSDIWYRFQWDTTSENNSQASFFSVDKWIHFSFAWYESIRDKFLLVLFTFIYATMIIYTMKVVPSIINGSSSIVGTVKSVSHQDNSKGGKE